jgi:hypothetical protein
MNLDDINKKALDAAISATGYVAILGGIMKFKMFSFTVISAVIFIFSIGTSFASSEYVQIKKMYDNKEYAQIIKKLNDRDFKDGHLQLLLARSYASHVNSLNVSDQKDALFNAFKHYQGAADKGIYGGAYQVAVYYDNGWGVDKDKDNAKKIFMKYEHLISTIDKSDIFSLSKAADYYSKTNLTKTVKFLKILTDVHNDKAASYNIVKLNSDNDYKFISLEDTYKHILAAHMFVNFSASSSLIEKYGTAEKKNDYKVSTFFLKKLANLDKRYFKSEHWDNNFQGFYNIMVGENYFNGTNGFIKN